MEPAEVETVSEAPVSVGAVFATPELLAYILGYLAFGDVPRVRAVCRGWNSAHFSLRCSPSDCVLRVKRRAAQCIERDDTRGLASVLALLDRDAASNLARDDLLAEACKHGCLAGAQWLAARFGLAPTDARRGENHALRLACGGGHRGLAQWLADHFGLTPADARAYNNAALRDACVGGHLATAQWLAARFGLTPADARCCVYAALREACVNGHFATAQWVVAHFGYAAADTELLSDATLRLINANGHKTVARWFWGLANQISQISIGEPAQVPPAGSHGF